MTLQLFELIKDINKSKNIIYNILIVQYENSDYISFHENKAILEWLECLKI